MTKRFVDTEIWNKDWFLDLSIKQKLLLKYIYDNCDCAGVYEISYRNLQNCFNEPVSKKDFEGLRQVKFISENKVFVEDFIKFQYGWSMNSLSGKNNNVQKGILKSLIKNELLPNPCPTLLDMDKDKDKTNFNIKNNINTDLYINNDIKNHNEIINDNIKNNNYDIKIHNEIVKNDKNCVNSNININTNNIKTNNNDIKNNIKNAVKIGLRDAADLMFSEYERMCPNLIRLTGERMSGKVAEKIRVYLSETDYDLELFKDLCRRANVLRTIANTRIDFETMLNCRIGILNGKYESKAVYQARAANERARREIEETRERNERVRNFKGDPMPESFKKLGERLRGLKCPQN